MALNFDKRIAFVVMESGGPEAWDEQEVVKAKAWADIKTLQGREIQNLNLTGNKLSSRFIIRHRTDISIDMQIKFKGNYYDITSMTNDNEENRTITIIAEAVV